jgi:hypothetical protein
MDEDAHQSSRAMAMAMVTVAEIWCLVRRIMTFGFLSLMVVERSKIADIVVVCTRE